jgi:hypothetical protein
MLLVPIDRILFRLHPGLDLDAHDKTRSLRSVESQELAGGRSAFRGACGVRHREPFKQG